MSFYEDSNGEANVSSYVITIVLCLGLLITIIWGVSRGVRGYSRNQNVLEAENNIKISQMNANNQVQLNEIQIQQTKQLIQVETQKAEIKVAEAKGIAEAQKIINTTLTDRYLQHEAIQAQEKMASSPNHTTIYIPSGQNGIPLVKTLE